MFSISSCAVEELKVAFYERGTMSWKRKSLLQPVLLFLAKRIFL